MKVIIAGDFCPQQRVAECFENGDFESVLGDVRGVISDADYSIVNFECPVTKGGEKQITKLGPNLGCSEKGIEAMKWVGFDCVTLANNHFFDYGREGVENTLDTCKKNKIDIVGGGINLQQASRILYKEIDGQTLAIINCCEHEFSIATEMTAGSNPLNPIQQYYAIKEARKKADYVLVIVHGGHEHFQLPSLRMQETFRFFVDSGADAVINHHQHCYSGYEIYKCKPIFYGLGNFCFDGNRSGKKMWYDGYLVALEFTSEIISFTIHPYRQCANEPKVVLLPKDSFNYMINELNETISNYEKLQMKVNSYYKECANNISSIFEPYSNRFFLGAKKRGWLPSLISTKRKIKAANFIRCEAHRDKLLYWLNML